MEIMQPIRIEFTGIAPPHVRVVQHKLYKLSDKNPITNLMGKRKTIDHP